MVESSRSSEQPVCQVAPGAAPGTPILDPDAPPPVIQVFCCRVDEIHEGVVEDLDQLKQMRADWPLVWINVDGLGDTAVISRLGELFGMHRLAIEDVVHVHQRPKIEEYDEGVFIVTRLQTLDEELVTEQVSFFFGHGFVISFQERQGDCFDPVRDRIRGGRGKIRSSGADYLLYALLDAIVDSIFPVLERLGDSLEELEDEILDLPLASSLARVHSIKRDLIVMRRINLPFRESISWLMRDATTLVQPETHVFLRDAYDHAVRVMESVEAQRELCADLTELYLSTNAHRLNEAMSLLTTIATIFIPLTFVAGIYGMNFDAEASPWNMPELSWYWGYPACLLSMLVVAVLMVLYFRSRGWLSLSQRRSRHAPR